MGFLPKNRMYTCRFRVATLEPPGKGGKGLGFRDHLRVTCDQSYFMTSFPQNLQVALRAVDFWVLGTRLQPLLQHGARLRKDLKGGKKLGCDKSDLEG